MGAKPPSLGMGPELFLKCQKDLGQGRKSLKCWHMRPEGLSKAKTTWRVSESRAHGTYTSMGRAALVLKC